MTAKSHECSACGGTGVDTSEADRRRDAYSRAWEHPGIPDYMKPPRPRPDFYPRCPVCLGSGRISDVRTAEVHSIGCVCADCSSAHERERADPRG